jgi:hypothetical protein
MGTVQSQPSDDVTCYTGGAGPTVRDKISEMSGKAPSQRELYRILKKDDEEAYAADDRHPYPVDASSLIRAAGDHTTIVAELCQLSKYSLPEKREGERVKKDEEEEGEGRREQSPASWSSRPSSNGDGRPMKSENHEDVGNEGHAMVPPKKNQHHLKHVATVENDESKNKSVSARESSTKKAEMSSARDGFLDMFRTAEERTRECSQSSDIPPLLPIGKRSPTGIPAAANGDPALMMAAMKNSPQSRPNGGNISGTPMPKLVQVPEIMQDDLRLVSPHLGRNHALRLASHLHHGHALQQVSFDSASAAVLDRRSREAAAAGLLVRTSPPSPAKAPAFFADLHSRNSPRPQPSTSSSTSGMMMMLAEQARVAPTMQKTFKMLDGGALHATNGRTSAEAPLDLSAKSFVNIHPEVSVAQPYARAAPAAVFPRDAQLVGGHPASRGVSQSAFQPAFQSERVLLPAASLPYQQLGLGQHAEGLQQRLAVDYHGATLPHYVIAPPLSALPPPLHPAMIMADEFINDNPHPERSSQDHVVRPTAIRRGGSQTYYSEAGIIGKRSKYIQRGLTSNVVPFARQKREHQPEYLQHQGSNDGSADIRDLLLLHKKAAALRQLPRNGGGEISAEHELAQKELYVKRLSYDVTMPFRQPPESFTMLSSHLHQFPQQHSNSAVQQELATYTSNGHISAASTIATSFPSHFQSNSKSAPVDTNSAAFQQRPINPINPINRSRDSSPDKISINHISTKQQHIVADSETKATGSAGHKASPCFNDNRDNVDRCTPKSAVSNSSLGSTSVVPHAEGSTSVSSSGQAVNEGSNSNLRPVSLKRRWLQASADADLTGSVDGTNDSSKRFAATNTSSESTSDSCRTENSDAKLQLTKCSSQSSRPCSPTPSSVAKAVDLLTSTREIGYMTFLDFIEKSIAEQMMSSKS